MIKKLIIMFLFFACFPDYVFAESKYNTETLGNRELKIIYAVEDFNIDSGKSKMSFGGYAFVEHIDNYGILKDSNIGNLTTYLVAYTGTWNDSYMDMNKCSNSEYCAYSEATQNNRNMFFSRCFEGEYCKTHDTKVEEYKKSNSFNNSTKCAFDYGSNCLYYNVGFDVDFSISSLVELEKKKRNEEDKIAFRIVLQLSGTNPKKFYSDFGVYEGLCYIDGKSCGNGEVSVGNYRLTISEMSSQVTVAPKSRARNSNCPEGGTRRKIDGRMVECSSDGVYFDATKVFDIVGITNFKGNFASWPVPDYLTIRTFDDRVFQLASEKNGGVIVPSDSRDPKKNYYAYGSWLTVTGQLTIENLEPKIKTYTCAQVGWSVKNSDATDDCNTSSIASYEECDSREVFIENRIYYPSSYNEESCSNGKKKFGDQYYVPVKIKTKILLHQTAEFEFGKVSETLGIDRTIISAGKGFYLTNSKYNNTVDWVNASVYSDTFAPYYGYEVMDSILEGGSCPVKSIDVKEDKIVKYCVKDTCNSNTDYDEALLKDAVVEVINYYVKKDLINEENVDKITYETCDSNDSSKCNTSFKKVDGSWSRDDNNSSESKLPNDKYNFPIGLKGRSITRFYNYNLPDAWVFLKDSSSGYNAGDVIYGTEVSEFKKDVVFTGNKIYIDYKWNYKTGGKNSDGVWPLNLSDNINPSLVRNMNWNLKGTCSSIKVGKGLYEYEEDSNFSLAYKYRSIALDAPFPKANSDYSNIAINWQEWIRENSNQKRVASTFENNPLYQVTLSKSSGDGIKISDLNAISTHYSDTSNLNKDNGSSKFISEDYASFFTRPLNGSFCPLGKFSESCDVRRGTE